MTPLSRHAAGRAAGWALALALAACGGTAAPGMVNAPGPQRAWTSDDLGHDAVANGPESCGKKAGGKDPLPGRFPPCKETKTGPIK